MAQPAIVLILVGISCLAQSYAQQLSGGRRFLQQEESTPSAVAAPSGTTVLYDFHAIGTQNYTAQANSSYLNTGAKADLYSGTMLRAHHYFVGNTPTFSMVDAATGLSIGIVHGKPAAKAAVARQADDGGFGSVADLLLTASGGEGTLSSVTHVQRVNTLGGVAPKGLFALPAYNGIPNFQLAVPYQADYIFLSGNGMVATPGG